MEFLYFFTLIELIDQKIRKLSLQAPAVYKAVFKQLMLHYLVCDIGIYFKIIAF